MIVTFIFIIMIILGFIIIKTDIGEDPEVYGWGMIILGSLVLTILLIMIVTAHATADMNIQKNKIKYEGLCRRYEIIKSEYEDVSKSDVISDITEWNMSVYNTKYWSENPWTNWFNPKKIADNLYYIPLDQESEDNNGISNERT